MSKNQNKALPAVFTVAESKHNTSKFSKARSESRRANHQKGSISEDIAADFLKDQGYTILERNFRFHRNEIDIIAKDREVLTFVEVKARKSIQHGYGFEAVNTAKQSLIKKVAQSYLIMKKLSLYDTPCRFDVISIDGRDITLFKNAF